MNKLLHISQCSHYSYIGPRHQVCFGADISEQQHRTRSLRTQLYDNVDIITKIVSEGILGSSGGLIR